MKSYTLSSKLKVHSNSKIRSQYSICDIFSVFALSTMISACADSSVSRDNIPLPTSAPSSVRMVAAGEFQSPGDAVASPDGSIFYFTAFTLDESPRPAIFSVPSEGGAASVLFAGEPLVQPTGLLMSCDGNTLFIANTSTDGDAGSNGSAEGNLFSLDISSNILLPLKADGIALPSGLAMDPNCSTLHVTGFRERRTGGVDELGANRLNDRESVLVTLPIEGGTATQTYAGTSLKSPTGVHVDVDGIAWVLDHQSDDDIGGILFAISPDGEVDSVISELGIGNRGGVSLAAGGVTAVIPQVDALGNSELLSINTQTGVRSHLPTPEIVTPAGIRTARNAGVFVVVDSEGDAIYRAE